MEEPKLPIPSLEQIEAEIERREHGRRYAGTLLSTLLAFALVIGLALGISYFCLGIVQLSGSSMSPSLEEGQIVLISKLGTPEAGDLLAFKSGSKLLIKRVVAVPGDSVSMDAAGNVLLNGSMLAEPYVSEKCLGDCELSFPLQLGVGEYFVLSDQRSLSSDSRNAAIARVSEDEILGTVLIRVWPISKIALF